MKTFLAKPCLNHIFLHHAPKSSCSIHRTSPYCYTPKFLGNPSFPKLTHSMVTKSYRNNQDITRDNDDNHVDISPISSSSSVGRSLLVAGAAASMGIALLLMMGETNKAWAFGPEGPLVEEFWDNVRRYGLYALTVSTGFLYAILQPIYELLKNPISAVLIIIILGGSFFIISQILSAMVGVSDFSYEYSY